MVKIYFRQFPIYWVSMLHKNIHEPIITTDRHCLLDNLEILQFKANRRDETTILMTDFARFTLCNISHMVWTYFHPLVGQAVLQKTIFVASLNTYQLQYTPLSLLSYLNGTCMRCVFNWLNFIVEMIDFNYIQCRMFTDHRTKKYMILSFDKKSFSYQLRRMEKYVEHTICRIYEDGRWTTSSFVGVRAHERTTNISIIIMIWSDL